MQSSISSSLSARTLIQYALLAGVAYILAGAPFLSIVTSYSGVGPQSASVQSSASFDRLESLVIPEANLSCSEHGLSGIYVLSREPLVVYIEGFLSDWEAKELVRLSEPHFTPSTIWNAGHETLDPLIRKSEKAPLPREQTVKCIEERARKLQGWRPYTFIEKLWSQRYGLGGHYTYHYDWSSASRTSGRVSSFMVYLEANCTGGGTHFPRLLRPRGNEWCKFIECDEVGWEGSASDNKAKLEQGVIFKPIAGNAVYWENMRSDGTGYLESWHAGLPVRSGTKIGLNIWSWFQDGLVPQVSQPESDMD